MGEHQPNSDQTPAPDSVSAPEGSRADAVSDGANSNFGPTLDAVPHEGQTPGEEGEAGGESHG